jgi:hypothetical protein
VLYHFTSEEVGTEGGEVAYPSHMVSKWQTQNSPPPELPNIVDFLLLGESGSVEPGMAYSLCVCSGSQRLITNIRQQKFLCKVLIRFLSKVPM